MKQEIFKKGSVTYYYASWFFPAGIRDEVGTLYAYVRQVDDLVDKKLPETARAGRMYSQTGAAWEGKKVQDPIVGEFVRLAKSKDFEWEWIEAFWRAMKWDLVRKDYQTWRDLENYIFGSAEVVGLMMAKIMRLPSEAMGPARMQGKAMQFINFVRDVKEDWELGRVYLPLEDRERFGVKKIGDGGWKDLIRFEIGRYRELQRGAETGYKFLPFKFKVAIKTAAEMYNWTANQIDKDPDVVWVKKVKPKKWRVLLQGLKNSLGL